MRQGRARRASGRNGATALALLGLAALGGCTDAAPDMRVGGDVRNAVARGQLTSPHAATLALVSLDGAPPDVSERFRRALTEQAARRDITVTDIASAGTLVREYVSAYPDEGGIRVAYTYDLFDAATRHRKARVADDTIVPPAGAAGDPWGAVTDTVLASLVGRAADDMSAALGTTPEAPVAAAQAVPATAD